MVWSPSFVAFPHAILNRMLSVQLLGSPQLLLDGRPLTIPRRKSRALIYYLAAHVRPLTRDHLLALFWPDQNRPAAQQVLRTTLHGLRKALGPALLVEENTLGLASEAEVDARQFERALRSPGPHLQPPTSVLSLYRGDFLEGFTLPDAPEFDDWISAERERYRRLAVRGFTTLAEQHEARADYPIALDALNRALEFDPLQEDLQRAAIRLHYLGGDRTGAIRRYDHLRKLLDAEMGIPPMAETRALYDAIITDALEIPSHKSRTPSAQSPIPDLQLLITPSLPFAGRTEELQMLRELLARGARQLTLVEGEPGIGKTRLADEFIRVSDALGLVGGARELEQALPYQPVIEALRSVLARPDWLALRAGLDLAPLWLGPRPRAALAGGNSAPAPRAPGGLARRARRNAPLERDHPQRRRVAAVGGPAPVPDRALRRRLAPGRPRPRRFAVGRRCHAGPAGVPRPSGRRRSGFPFGDGPPGRAALTAGAVSAESHARGPPDSPRPAA